MIVSLSRPWRAATPRIAPRMTPGFSTGGALTAQERTISAARSRKSDVVDADRRRRHHAEIGQYRIAAADRRHAVEHAAEPFRPRHLLDRGARIGDRDEMRCRFGLAERLLGALEEILLEDVGFERAARFARDDEQRPLQVDRAFDAADLRRIGRVDDLQSREARPAAKALRQHLGAEARSAHAEQQDVGEPGALDLGGERLQMAGRLQLRVDDREPAEPLAFVGFGPQRGLARPQAPDLALGCATLRAWP